MPTGKPDFNLNSFGIKYLSKDEVQEFLEKRTQGEEIGSKGDRSQTAVVANTPKGLQKPVSARPTRNVDPQTGFTSNAPTPPTQAAVATDSTVNDVNTGNKKLKTPSKKLEGGTRSVFTSREKPKKLSNRERHLREDIESSPKTRLNNRGETVQDGNRKVDESGVIGGQSLQGTKQKLMQKPQPTTEPNEGVQSRTREQVGGIIGDREYSKEGEGKKVQLDSNSRFNPKTNQPEKLTESKARLASGQTNTNSEGKKKKQHKMAKRTTKLDSKQEKNTAGDAPEGVETETQNIGGSNVKVGVGVDAHKKLQEDNVGGLRRAQRVRSGTGHEGKNIGRGKGERKDSNLNDMSDTSKRAKDHDTRGKKYKWENDEDKAGYNAIKQVKHSKTGKMVNDRVAQIKYLNSMDEKYKRSVTEQPKRSTAGQKIIDEMSKKKKKSNDIITDMNIIKLDLMKGKKYLKRERLGSVIGKPKNVTNDGVADYEKGDDNDFFSLDDKALKSQAEETIFKAISLKLDLMKDSKDGKGSNKPMFGSDDIPFTDSFAGDRAETNVINYLETYGGDDEPTGTTLDKLQEVDGDGKAAYLNAPNMTKKQPIKPKIASAASETIFKAISLKLDLMNKLDTSPKGMKGQKFVRGSMASAGRKPATKLPNAGGVQDKLENMRDEAPKETPEKQAKDKKLLETGATGEPSGSVANRYS